jgi:hypothetical protein
LGVVLAAHGGDIRYRAALHQVRAAGALAHGLPETGQGDQPMATTSRSHRNADDWLTFREPQFERPRPGDPGADEDVPTERESEEGRERNPRTAADERARDLAETAEG